MQEITDESDLAFWLAISERPSLAPRDLLNSYLKSGALTQLHGSIGGLTQLGKSQNDSISFRQYLSSPVFSEYRKLAEDFKKKGIQIVRFNDKEYPKQLRGLTETTIGPPLVLFRKGSLTNFESCVAISGTRDCSFQGRSAAMETARVLASKKYTVVSGLARGVDEFAHFGALRAKNGKTIAVVPWMDPLYPPEHVELAADIQERGAILSEHYRQNFGKGARGKFVERNRITSGLSLCVIAIESDIEGGTVHQVDLALAQGKRVFALVPRKGDRAKRGYDLFLQRGASPMNDVDDVLDYLKDMQHSARDQQIETFYPNPQKQLKPGEMQREDSL